MKGLAILTALAVGTSAAVAGPGAPGHTHTHAGFSAGQPGDPKQPARVVNVVMREDGRKMLFEPSRLEIRKGEQVRFVITNSGLLNHEFVLATVVENRKHARVMKKFPHMEHDDPNARQVPPYLTDEIVWRFTNAGEFEFACLIPGHYERGMFGKIVVK
jgi:uncharacterized cupredoxin-like copper-binding protein